jgi:F0F1-type ATP synthase epsilon subunit
MEKIKVFVTSREERIFDGTCDSVTSLNEVGEFDILSQHANFTTLIKKYIIINKNQENEQKINIDKGVLTTSDNAVQIYVQE